MTVLLQWKTLPVGIYVDVTLLRTTHLNTVANQHPLLHKLWLPHKVPHQTTKTARKQLNSSVLCFLSLSSNSDLNLITEVCNPHDLRDQMSQFQKCCETKRILTPPKWVTDSLWLFIGAAWNVKLPSPVHLTGAAPSLRTTGVTARPVVLNAALTSAWWKSVSWYLWPLIV